MQCICVSIQHPYPRTLPCRKNATFFFVLFHGIQCFSCLSSPHSSVYVLFQGVRHLSWEVHYLLQSNEAAASPPGSRFVPRLSQKFSLPQLKALPLPAVSPTSSPGMTAPKAQLTKETISRPCDSQFSCASFCRWGSDSFSDCELCPWGLVPFYILPSQVWVGINSWWHLKPLQQALLGLKPAAR